MRSIIRLLKGAGILNIIGMTAAFAAIYIILVQVNHDWNYNSHIKDIDRIYTLAAPHFMKENGKYSIKISRPLGEAIAKRSANVEAYGVFNGCNLSTVKVEDENGERTLAVSIAKMTSGTLDVFGFQAITGTFDNIGTSATVALSESTAERLGLTTGDVLTVEGEDVQRTVTAIYKDMPTNSTMREAELIYCNTTENAYIDTPSEWSFTYFVKLKPGSNTEELNSAAVSVAEELLKEQIAQIPDSDKPTDEEYKTVLNKYTIKAFPVKGLHFSKQVEFLTMINKNTTVTLFIMAVLILVITLINFTNFFMAQVPVKLRSVNTRKILGSSRTSLIGRFMAEAALLVLISLVSASCIVVMFKSSTYANLVSLPVDIEQNIPVAAITAIVALVMTLAASIYPAWYVTSFPTAMALKGAMGSANKGKRFRYALVMLQFMISIGFMLCAAFVKMQYDFMMNYDMGFNKESLFTANVPAKSSNRDLFTRELKSKPAIKDVAWGAAPLTSIRMSWGRQSDEKSMYFFCYPVSYNFLDFMDIKITEGRDFMPSDEVCEKGVFIFNQETKDKYDLTLEDKCEGHLGETNIAGFCENFRFQSLHYPIETLAFYVFGKDPWWKPTHLYIRSNAGATYKEVQAAVRETVKEVAPYFNTEEVTLKFFNEELGTQYRKEQQLIKLITIFTILAISISLIGIVGLLMFETKFRRKEIGVRRVHGASITEVLGMLNKKFMYLLLLGFAVAMPVSYFIMDYYYSTFVVRPPLHWWVFVLVLAAVSAVTTCVVTLCSYNAASENPAKTLKNE